MYVEKPLSHIAESEMIGAKAVGQNHTSVLVLVSRITAGAIHGYVRSKDVSVPWNISFDKRTGLSLDGAWHISYVGQVPGGISNSDDLVLGFMQGRESPR